MNNLKTELLNVDKFELLARKLMSKKIINIAKEYIDNLKTPIPINPREFLSAFMIYKFPEDSIGSYEIENNKNVIDLAKSLIDSKEENITKLIIKFCYNFKIWKEEDLKGAWDSERQESKAAFGNDDMYMEKLIEEPRHIEIQIVGDSNGKACHLSERDCSVQRRHQKLTEEVPSPFMTDALRKKMGAAAVKAAEFIKYEGAGTVEFLVDKHRNFYFMEMNTRIQVEHPITEQVIDFDLIREQILVASGVAISGKNYFPNLHSIECRINAEDPFNDFRPSPGKITTLHSPGGHGVRLDTHVYAGYVIPPNYDSMIAKLITTAQTREEAINKMKRALDEFVIEGIKTTIPFHRQLMEHPDYVAGNYTTKFMEDFVIETSN